MIKNSLFAYLKCRPFATALAVSLNRREMLAAYMFGGGESTGPIKLHFTLLFACARTSEDW